MMPALCSPHWVSEGIWRVLGDECMIHLAHTRAQDIPGTELDVYLLHRNTMAHNDRGVIIMFIIWSYK